MDTFSSILLFIIGSGLLAFSRQFTRSSLEYQRKTFNVQYGQKEEKVTLVWLIIFGVLLILWSLWNLLLN